MPKTFFSQKTLWIFHSNSKIKYCTEVLNCLPRHFHGAVPVLTSSPPSSPAVHCVLSRSLEPGLENPSERHRVSQDALDSAQFSLPVIPSSFLMRSEGCAGALAQVRLRAKREGVCGFTRVTSLSTCFAPLGEAGGGTEGR